MMVIILVHIKCRKRNSWYTPSNIEHFGAAKSSNKPQAQASALTAVLMYSCEMTRHNLDLAGIQKIDILIYLKLLYQNVFIIDLFPVLKMVKLNYWTNSQRNLFSSIPELIIKVGFVSQSTRIGTTVMFR